MLGKNVLFQGGYFGGIRSHLGGLTQRVKSWYWGRPLVSANNIENYFSSTFVFFFSYWSHLTYEFQIKKKYFFFNLNYFPNILWNFCQFDEFLLFHINQKKKNNNKLMVSFIENIFTNVHTLHCFKCLKHNYTIFIFIFFLFSFHIKIDKINLKKICASNWQPNNHKRVRSPMPKKIF